VKTKCVNCGLIYDPKARPLPACGSDDGPTGPKGAEQQPVSGRMLLFIRCVLSVRAPKRKAKR